MAKRPALGRGIGALLNTAAQEGGKKYFHCPIEDLRPHGNQPRKTFNDEKLEELAASVREKGIIQPLVVRRVSDYYQIIAGERRWRAAQKAGLDKIPVVIQDVSEDWALEMALIENIQREDLTALEEAEAYQYLINAFDLSQEGVAKRVGKERPTVANALRLLKLPGRIRNDLNEGRLSMGHARALLALVEEEDMVEAAQQIINKKLSVRDTEKLIKKIKSFGITPPKLVKSEIDPNLETLANAITQRLGAKSRVLPKGEGGKIEVGYQNLDDLDRLLELLGVSL